MIGLIQHKPAHEKELVTSLPWQFELLNTV
jgi:hypothetical protein